MGKHSRARQNKTRHKKKTTEQKYRNKAPKRYKSKETVSVDTE